MDPCSRVHGKGLRHDGAARVIVRKSLETRNLYYPKIAEIRSVCNGAGEQDFEENSQAICYSNPE